MEKMQYSFDELGLSSSLVRSLINNSDTVKEFTSSFFSEETLLMQADLKEFSKEKRAMLVSVLEKQNANIMLSDLSKENIGKLSSADTFTITTGHQLNMATGPLYTLYKILEVINWSEKINEKQGAKSFVPVFWMATEDHDFEEINNINLFGTKIDWEHESAENSIVGRIDTDAASSFISRVLEKFKDEDLNSKITAFLASYSNNYSLASANRELINSLFGEYGLVIIDGDDIELKEAFLPIAKLEIEQSITYDSVSATNKVLESAGFHQQVYVRENNLFYIEPNGVRVRIERKSNGFLLNEKKYSEEGLIELLTTNPDRFSPNALMRPLYQETVLPNVAYIGGGGEIAYWLQLKSTFQAFNVTFPLLKVRESVLLVDERMNEQMNEFGYSIVDLKMNSTDLLKDYVTKNQKIELKLSDQREELVSIKNAVLEKALIIDKNATTFIEAEFQRMDNQIDKMEKKFIASEKKNQEKAIKKLTRLQNRLYPGGGFQERYENYLNYIQYPSFIERIKTELKQRTAAKAAIQVIKIK